MPTFDNNLAGPRFSLIAKITLAVSLLTTVFLCAMALIGGHYFENQFKESISNQQFTLVTVLADEIDQKMLAAQGELVAVARIFESMNIDTDEEVQRQLEQRLDTQLIFDNALSYFSADGTLLAVTPTDPALLGENFSFRDYFKQTLATQTPQISEAFLSASTHHHPIVMFTAPLFDPEGRIKGVLGGSIDLLNEQFFGRLSTAKKLGHGGYLYIFDKNRQLLVHPDRDRIMRANDIPTNSNRGVEKALAGFEGTIETINSRGLHVLASFKRLESTGWILAANYPVAEAFAPLARARATFWPALMAAVLLAVPLVSSFIGHLTKPLLRATRHVEKLSLCDDAPLPIPVTTHDEIGTLSQTFNRLLETMSRNRLALKEQLHFIQVLVDTLPNPIFYKDADLRYLGCNKALESYLGISRTDLIGKSVHEIAPPDLAAKYDQADRELLGQGGTQTYESAVTYPDGNRHDVIFYKAVFFNANGSLGGLIGTFLDITARKLAEENVRKQKAFSDKLVDNTTVPTFVIDAEHRIVIWNRACEKLTGFGADRMLGTSDHWQAFYPDRRPCLSDVILDGNQSQLAELYKTYAPSQLTPGGLQAEGWFADLNGQARYILFSAAPILDDEGKILAAIETLEDQTAQRLALEQVNKLGQAMEQSPASIMITDSSGKIEYINPKFTQLTGYLLEEVFGKSPAILNTGHTSPEEYRHLWETLLNGREWHGEFLNKKKNGDFYWESASISPVLDANGRITHFVAVKEDITQRKADKERLQEKDQHLHYLAHHDTLTGLPNRTLFQDRLRHAIGKAGRTQKNIALLLLDLDRFKNINDSLGHNVGDELLRQVAKRIKTCVRETDTVARFGGDEFVIIFEDIEHIEKVAFLAQKLQQALTKATQIGENELYISSSIGISLYPEDGRDVEALLSSADVAMYRAKAKGRNTHAFYTADMNARTHEFLRLESELRRAIDQNQLELHYQPQIDLASRAVVGAEALIRWRNPERGLISPADFIPLAEETGLIVPIGQWVLQTACSQAKRWQDQGYPPISMAVNISGRQFNQPAFVDMLDDIVKNSGLDPRWLELEITESVIMEDVDESIMTLTDLKIHGYHLSIDDFGTGYSSLSYLKRFPISKLKIDQSFVRDIAADENSAAIVSAIIALTKSMDLQIIAEGVETEEQVQFLINKGCFFGQGYLFSRPLPADEFERFCQKKALR
jgi:two-component system NtrC family sensor kinase